MKSYGIESLNVFQSELDIKLYNSSHEVTWKLRTITFPNFQTHTQKNSRENYKCMPGNVAFQLMNRIMNSQTGKGHDSDGIYTADDII